jgi:hypothetical protein
MREMNTLVLSQSAQTLHNIGLTALLFKSVRLCQVLLYFAFMFLFHSLDIYRRCCDKIYRPNASYERFLSRPLPVILPPLTAFIREPDSNNSGLIVLATFKTSKGLGPSLSNLI